MRNKFDLSAYFVVGPENTKGRNTVEIIKDAIKAGFTFVQVRSKEASAKELIDITVNASKVISELKKENEVALVVDDRLDVVLAAREMGAKVDGIHVGQTDIPVSVCRKYLGEDSIIGLSAKTDELISYVKSVDVSGIDYFGAGPLHETETKKDCGLNKDGVVVTRSLDELRELANISPIPVVIGGGVKVKDLNELAQTGVDGFFVVSAVSEADVPYEASLELVNEWKKRKGDM